MAGQLQKQMDTINIQYIAVAILMAIASGLVGSFALMKRMTLAADSMSHVALPGIALAVIYKIDPMLGGAATLVLGALIVWFIGRKSNVNTDAIIGVIFAVSLAIGALTASSEDLIDALFGGFGNITFLDSIIGVAGALAVIGFIFWKHRELVLTLVSKDLAKTAGVKTDRLNLYFLLIFALTVILGLRFMGALLMGSLIIIPAAIAKNLARNLNSMLFYASLAAIVSVSGGMVAAAYTNLALGPITIVIAAVLFFLSLFVPKRS